MIKTNCHLPAFVKDFFLYPLAENLFPILNTNSVNNIK